jgi:hypothetical protein
LSSCDITARNSSFMSLAAVDLLPHAVWMAVTQQQLVRCASACFQFGHVAGDLGKAAAGRGSPCASFTPLQKTQAAVLAQVPAFVFGPAGGRAVRISRFVRHAAGRGLRA